MKAALDGITVLDLTQFESGTVCTETLAWLGANVIKVERPGTGEQGRGSSVDQPGADSYLFILVNANKKSVTIDIKHPEGKKLLERLVEKSDIFVENFSPGTIERMGLDYDSVRAINPRIIYAQIKGFGAGSPYANFPAFDPVGQAMGGVVSITGERDKPPLRAGPNLADSGTGFHCVIGILAALYQRTWTGEGQRVEVAMQDAMINFIRPAFGRQLVTGKATERVGNDQPMAPVAPNGIYPCKPGGPNDYVFIYTSRWPGSKQWEQLLDV
ncbi:MAG TPA: CoA transferase, partial [Anaerolineae bacterium]